MAAAVSKTAPGLAAALACALALAQDPTVRASAELPLQHRSAEALLAVLRPLAAPASLAGGGDRLQARGSAAEMARVRALVGDADHEPAALSVSLGDEAPAQDSGDAGSVAPQAPGNSVTLSTGSPLPADPHGNAQVLGTSSSARPDSVIEGELLRVSMPATQSLRFRTRPVPRAAASHGAAGTVDAGGTVFFEARSDFTLRLWRVGRLVAVQVQPLAAGRVTGARAGEEDSQPPATTVVYGPLGRWFALADSGRTAGPDAAGAGGAARSGLWIRVQVPAP